MTKRINLALQGGGAHGAFTWGVLDRLLDEPDIQIAGISGTSAGALNGAALKAGLIEGGAVAAKASRTPFSPNRSEMGTTREWGTTRREAAPPKRPRTSPKHRAPGTNTRSPTRRCVAGPAMVIRPTVS